MNQHYSSDQQPILPSVSIDPVSILEHGESPTALILAIAILLSTLISSMTRLVQVIMRQQNHH